MNRLAAIPFVEITEDKPSVIAPVTVYPTRISLSSWRGCNLKCSYCVLQSDPVDANPFSAQRVSSVAELLAGLDHALRENTDISTLKLTINDHTDPFLTPEIAEDTLAILEGLAARRVTAPIMITTKMPAGEKVIERLAILKDRLRMTVFVSIADFSTGERVELVDVGSRFEALKHFVCRGIHTVLYLKPIGPWTDIAVMTAYLQRYVGYVSEIIISPLKGQRSDYPHIPLDDIARYSFGGDVEDAVVNAILAVNPAIKVSRKRSCSVNRRNQLSCRPPLFGSSPANPAADLFANAVSTNGYCEVRPKAVLNGRPDLHLALSFIGAQLDKLGIRWALIGSMQRAIDAQTERMMAVNDIDIAVPKADQDRLYHWLKNFGAAPKAFIGCGGSCSLRGKAMHLSPQVVDFDRYRSTLRIVVAGVFVDITSNDKALREAALAKRAANIMTPLS